MNLYVGTSGYSYKEWKGNFYPEDLPDKKMLNFYSGHFNTVEINNTFYKMPKKEVFESWTLQVPPGFKFVIKAPKRITHINKLEADDSVDYFINTSLTLKHQLGVLLFQLPPYSRKDIEKLQTFVDVIPENIKAAFEFRNNSWLDVEVYDCLKKRNFALCISDTDEKPLDEIIKTADWTYLRLRRLNYDDGMLKEWRNKIASGKWEDIYVFFKHEDEGKGPEFAKRFMDITGEIKQHH
jgi:uncharacterized protein YecE (DUF72 family)